MLFRAALPCPSRRPRLCAHNYDAELRDQRRDRAKRRENRSGNGAYRRDSDRNFDESIAMLILNNDALHVAFVNQRPYFVDQVAAEYLDFFYEVLECHESCPHSMIRRAYP